MHVCCACYRLPSQGNITAGFVKRPKGVVYVTCPYRQYKWSGHPGRAVCPDGAHNFATCQHTMGGVDDFRYVRSSLSSAALRAADERNRSVSAMSSSPLPHLASLTLANLSAPLRRAAPRPRLPFFCDPR